MSGLIKSLENPQGQYERVGRADVPWHFGDFTSEYKALRGGCGLIDYSAGGPIAVTGPGAAELVQFAVARDVEFLVADRAISSLILTPAGDVLDVVTIVANDEGFLVLTGPGAEDDVATALLQALERCGADATVVNHSADVAVFAAEGPSSWRSVAAVVGSEYVTLAYESSLPIEIDGVDALVARLGVTGEYGYTFVAPVAVARRLWDALIDNGATPVGHQAREVAMFEVRQPIIHREVAAGEGVVRAGLNWLVDRSKEDFVGREAVDQVESDAGRPIGFRVTGGVVAAGDEVFAAGRAIGRVKFVLDSPGAGGILGLAEVESQWQASRMNFTTPQGELTTLAPPYVVPESWSTTIRV